MRCAWSLLVVVGTGCWHAPSPPPSHEPALAPAVAAAPPAVPVRSVWRGYYECAQGRTAVQLTIAARASGAAKALFEFGPHDGNPEIPQGSYRLTGTLRERGDGSLELALEPQRWIDRPAGYTMTGVAARSDVRRRRLEGRILADTCRDIVVERVR